MAQNLGFVVRPLSPHLSAYSAQYSSRLSISHRVTGCALGFVRVACVLVLGVAEVSVSYAGALVGQSWFVLLLSRVQPFLFGVLFCRLLSLSYHGVNGIRHLVWDTGSFLDKSTRARSSQARRVLAFCVVLLLLVGGERIEFAL